MGGDGGGESITTPWTCQPTMPSKQTKSSTTTAAATSSTTTTTAAKSNPSYTDVLLGLLRFLTFIVVLVALLFGGKSSGDPNPTFQVDHFSMSPFKLSDYGMVTTKTPDLSVLFSSGDNPNRSTALVYENVVVSVFYKNEIILVSAMPRFEQKENERKIEFRASSVAVLPGYDNMYLQYGFWSKSCFPTVTRNLTVRMDSVMRHGNGTRSLRVSCEGVKIKYCPLEGGAMLGEPVECRVKVVTDQGKRSGFLEKVRSMV